MPQNRSLRDFWGGRTRRRGDLTGNHIGEHVRAFQDTWHSTRNLAILPTASFGVKLPKFLSLKAELMMTNSLSRRGAAA